MNTDTPQPRILPRPPIGMFYEPAGVTLPAGPAVNIGIIGLGHWGREIISQLNALPNAPIVAVCDHYQTALRRGGEPAPQAIRLTDYRQLLDSAKVRAVVVATPTHQHREIVLAALQAGKHVYCEAPLAHTIEDARAIALAARASQKTIFQSGLQLRRNPHRRVQLAIVRGGGIGKPFLGRAQSHQKRSWAAVSSDADREKELNWRIQPEFSTGLAGEIGIHQLDLFCWYLNSRPIAVSGTGSVIQWKDGRNVPDTVHARLEFPECANLYYDATLANAFENDCEFLNGTFGTLMMRGNKGWILKETDAPLTAWEDWARREYFFGQLALALRVGSAEDAFPNPPLYYALEAFVSHVGHFEAGDQASIDALKLNLAPGWKEGFEATVLALKTNEAILKKDRISLENNVFGILSGSSTSPRALP